MRRAGVGVLAVVALLLATVGPAAAATKSGDPTAARKAAQSRANAAAARLAKAQTALALVQADITKLQRQQATSRAHLDQLVGQVKAVAVNEYVRGGLPSFAFNGDLSSNARRQAFIKYVAVGDTDAIDALRAAQEDFDRNHSVLRDRLAAQQKAAAALRADARKAQAELARLAAAEKAFLAKQAASRHNGGSAASRGRLVGIIASGSWICPVQGPHAFSDDFGAPRGGGTRRHQGNDILAPMGTPVVANVSGSVARDESALGGHSYFLHGNDGNTYFGAHLSAYGASGSVAAGTVIGYVGNTGDARGGPPHLHFEIHPGGGAAVDPYPVLRQYC